jgi:general stress protein YciG
VGQPRREDDPLPEGRDRDDIPDTPPTDPPPVPVEEPPATPGPQGPYVVGHDEEVAVDGVRKERRGFASMSPEKQREIASKGGRAAHEKGTAHEWTPDEARAAGRKGGQISRGGRGRLIPSAPSDGSTLDAAPASGMEPGRAE